MIKVKPGAKILILEDDPERHKKFKASLIGCVVTIVTTAWECANELETHGPWDLVFLDHDLGGDAFVSPSESNTGSAVVRRIIKMKLQLPPIVVHSMNPGAASMMVASLNGSGYEAHLIPFCDLKLKVE